MKKDSQICLGSGEKETGYQVMTINDVAKEVGVTKGTLSLYFKNQRTESNPLDTVWVASLISSSPDDVWDGSDSSAVDN